MKKVFGVEKFKGLLLAGSFTILVNYLVRLSDSVVVGNLLGIDALAGVNLASPILSVLLFFSNLVASGMATNYSLAMGRCEKTRARQFFMQAVWTILLVGGFLSALIYFGSETFVSYMSASDEISMHARSYLSWVWAAVVPNGLMTMLVMLCYADGDARLCAASYAVNLCMKLAVSVVAVTCGMGTAGCPFAMVVADSASILVLAAHFLRKSNSFAPVRHFALADSWRIVLAAFGDAATFLCNGLLFFFLNKFVIQNFGSSVLPVVSVVTMLWGFLEFFDGIGVALQPIVTVYYGEGNLKSLRRVMLAATRVAVVEGVAFMLVFGLFPDLVTMLVGIREPALVQQSAIAIRCMCGAFVALAFVGLFNSYYMFVERSALAGAVTFLSYLVLPVACVAAGSLFGVEGVWAGMGAGPFVGLLVVSLVIVSTAGFKAFPLLLPRDRDEKTHVFNLRLTNEEIAETSRRIGELPGVPMRASLMAEEVFMVVKDRNKGRTVLGEASVDLNDGIRLILRDDGEIFDITDADARISSLRTFLVASIMEKQAQRLNFVSTGFNRNIFDFS